ncbi:immunoglobulin I-set domain protein, partial [Ancylostoma caninum]
LQSEEVTPTSADVSEAVRVQVIDDSETLSAKKEDTESAANKLSAKSKSQTSSKKSSKKEQKEKLQNSQGALTPSTAVNEAVKKQVLDDNEKRSVKKESTEAPLRKTAIELKFENSADNLEGTEQEQKSPLSEEVTPKSANVSEAVKVQVIDDSEALSAKKEDAESAAKEISAKSKTQTSSKKSSKKEQKEKLQKGQEDHTLSTVVNEAVKKLVLDDKKTLLAEKKGIGSLLNTTPAESNNENPSDKLQTEEFVEKSQNKGVYFAQTAVSETVKESVMDDNETSHKKEGDLESPAISDTVSESKYQTPGYSSNKGHKKSQKSQEFLLSSIPVSGSVKEEVVGSEDSCGMEKSVQASMKSPAKLQKSPTKSPKKKSEESKKQLGDYGRDRCEEHVESEESEIEFSKFKVKHSSSLGACGLAEDEASVGHCFPIPLIVRVELKVVSIIGESVVAEHGSFPAEKRDNEESNLLQDSRTSGAKLEIGSPAPREAETTTLSSFAQRQPLSRKPSKIKPKSYISKETEKLLRRKAKAKQNSSEIDNVAGNSAPTDDLFALSLKKGCDEFGNQSTDPMTDQTNDSDFVMERSESETIIGGGPKFTAADEHPKKNQQSGMELSTDQNSGKACAPSFLQKRQTVKCTERKSLAINVFLVASPQPAISVYHNNDHVICANQVEPVDTPEHNLYSFTFTIDRVRFEDSGKLMFKAENLHGFDECTAYLEIAEEVKPSNT